jgi:hypothetical protein
MKFIKMYIWAFKESYNFMQGNRDAKFWFQLPFKAFWIAYKSI